MEIKSHIKLIIRNYLIIIFAIILLSPAIIIAGNKYTLSSNQGTIFTTINTKENIFYSQTYSQYEDVKSADHFTETLQGWFKNPSFLEEINKDIYNDNKRGLSISAERQEKQNLIINFKYDDKSQLKNIESSIIKNLKNQIEKYNKNTNTEFQIAIYDTFSSEIKSKKIPLYIFAFIASLLIGILIAYLYEFITEKTIDIKQIENIFGKEILVNINKIRCKIMFNNFEKSLINKKTNKEKVFVFTWKTTKKEEEKFKKQFNKIKYVNLLKNPEKIQKNSDIYIIIKIGKTTTSILNQINLSIKEEYSIITI